MMRLGFFGGSFDPPHRGHMAIARAAADAFKLERVLFAPTGLQPLKPGGAQASYEDRLAMVELVTANDDGFIASDVDHPRADGRANYTVDALSTLARLGEKAAIYSIVGADSFLELPRWREAHRLLRLAEWIVSTRPGFDLGSLNKLSLSAEELRRVHVLDAVMDEVSATELRLRLGRGEACFGLLTPEVRAYIGSRGLYGFAAGQEATGATLKEESG